jgi:PAS domain S-box-containing protein
VAQTGDGDACFGLLMDTAPVMIRVADANKLCIWFNRTWLDFIGRSMDEAAGNGWTACIHPDDLARCIETYAAHFDRREPFRMEYRLRRADGEYRWILDAGVPRYAEGERFDGYVCSALDISALKETEEDLRSMIERRERALVDAQQAGTMAQLTGGTAHELNNLLTVIAGNLALIERRAGEDERLANLARKASKAASRGGRLARQLLALATNSPAKPQPLRLDTLVADLAGTLELVLGEHIALETAVGPELWTTSADPIQVQSTLVNVALNARDAMPTGGTVRIEASNVAIRPEGGDDIAPGSYVLVKVTDTGTGMPPEILRRACEPFFSTKEPGRASGLGLSQAHGFLRQARGALRLNSAAGQGTTVRLYLPIWSGESEADPVPLPADTILVAEDDEDVRELAVDVLEALGFSVLEAADGCEALAVLRGDQPIRLLFTDILMPCKNGIEVAREARALRPELPVLFTSGYASRRLIQETALDPETHILRKPWLPEDLDREIRAALGREVN